MATGQGQHLYPSWGPTLVSMGGRQGGPMGSVLWEVWILGTRGVMVMEERERVVGCSEGQGLTESRSGQSHGQPYPFNERCVALLSPSLLCVPSTLQSLQQLRQRVAVHDPVALTPRVAKWLHPPIKYNHYTVPTAPSSTRYLYVQRRQGLIQILHSVTLYVQRQGLIQILHSHSVRSEEAGSDPDPPLSYCTFRGSEEAGSDPDPPLSYTVRSEEAGSDPDPPLSHAVRSEEAGSDPDPPLSYTVRSEEAGSDQDPPLGTCMFRGDRVRSRSSTQSRCTFRGGRVPSRSSTQLLYIQRRQGPIQILHSVMLYV
ncbi:UNVERIFIED_CONTAM: hypothetical protein FKN15_076836 [Acipenser sinensis]